MVTKLFAGLLLVTVFSQTFGYNELTYIKMKGCQAEHNMGEDVITQVRAFNSLPNERPYKCFLACWMDKLGVLTMDKNTNKRVADLLCKFNYDDEESQKKAQSFIDYCEDKVELSEKCQSAYEVYECYAKLIRENPEVGRHIIHQN